MLAGGTSGARARCQEQDARALRDFDSRRRWDGQRDQRSAARASEATGRCQAAGNGFSSGEGK
eukprot:4670407-Prymnesium_polylepis.1